MAAFTFYFPVPGTPTGEGYSLSFKIAGTNTATPAYQTSSLGSAWAQPIVFNEAGSPDGPIYLPPTPALKVVYTDGDGVAVSGYPYDNYSPLEVGS